MAAEPNQIFLERRPGMTHEPENFEKLLDQALQSYSSAEPRSGLDERILAHVSSQSAVRSTAVRNLLWMAAITASLAAILVVIVSSIHPTRERQTLARILPPHTDSLTAQPSVPLSKPPTRHARQSLHHVSRVSPVLQRGLPQLTSEDRLLVQFASLHPQEVLIFSQQQKAADRRILAAPLQIDSIASNPITIAPIASNSDERVNF
jgi:hypothetical protein